MKILIKLYIDPNTSPSMYWARVETTYDSPAYCRGAGNGTLPLVADTDGNYHLQVLLEETSAGNAVSPVVHILDLGELTCANSETTLTVTANLIGGGGSTGTVRLEDAEQESRPDHQMK